MRVALLGGHDIAKSPRWLGARSTASTTPAIARRQPFSKNNVGKAAGHPILKATPTSMVPVRPSSGPRVKTKVALKRHCANTQRNDQPTRIASVISPRRCLLFHPAAEQSNVSAKQCSMSVGTKRLRQPLGEKAQSGGRLREETSAPWLKRRRVHEEVVPPRVKGHELLAGPRLPPNLKGSSPATFTSRFGVKGAACGDGALPRATRVAVGCAETAGESLLESLSGDADESLVCHRRRHPRLMPGCARCLYEAKRRVWERGYGCYRTESQGRQELIVWLSQRPARMGGAWALGCTFCAFALARKRGFCELENASASPPSKRQRAEVVPGQFAAGGSDACQQACEVCLTCFSSFSIEPNFEARGTDTCHIPPPPYVT